MRRISISNIKQTLLMTSAVMSLLLFSCGSSNRKSGNQSTTKSEQEMVKAIDIPSFDADSAFQYTKEQCDFGPRVPNSQAHKACAKFLANKLRSFGAQVTEQAVDLIAYDDQMLHCVNIIGSYKPESKKRIALFSHWDSRPFADHDPDVKNRHTPIDGANDGASGVGVLLELARQIQQKSPEMGVDIVFFDAEDYGAPEYYKGEKKDEYWCLGSQYWARQPHVSDYMARYGILLDMVGGKDATFYYEYYSMQYASKLTKKIWSVAKELGYGRYFISEDGGGVTDDHVFVNQLMHLPTTDIIPYQAKNKHSSFGSTWHTLNDNMSAISVETLKAVGQTITTVVYREQ